jgi:glycosyltransferase involved in cell wall biosynthesis
MVIQRFRPSFSGHGVQVEELCKALARRGVAASIVTASPEERFVGVERAEGYEIHRLSSRLRVPLPSPTIAHLRSPIFAARTFRTLIAWRGRFDLIHVHALTDALYAAWLAARLLRVPTVFEMTLVGSDDPIAVRKSTNRLLGPRLAIYERCDGYVAISPAIARRYEEAGLPRDRLRVIPQGVDLERFVPPTDRRADRGTLGLPSDVPLLAFVGSLIERKGIDVLLEAWARIHRERPDAHLVLIGRDDFSDDPEAGTFLEQHLQLLSDGAVRNIHRTGVRENTERYLRSADLFVFPSRREGFGSAIIEAMACGLPCVVADLPGITDFIFADPGVGGLQLGIDGIVIPQDDPQAFARAALDVLAKPQQAAAIGLKARARIEANFGFDSIAAAYLKLYAELCSRRKG